MVHIQCEKTMQTSAWFHGFLKEHKQESKSPITFTVLPINAAHNGVLELIFSPVKGHIDALICEGEEQPQSALNVMCTDVKAGLSVSCKEQLQC